MEAATPGGDSGGTSGSGSTSPPSPVDDRPTWVKVGDAAYNFVNDWKLEERMIGVGKIIAGGGLTLGGAAIAGVGVGTEVGTLGVSTPVSAPVALFGGFVGLIGIDLAGAGVKETITGGPAQTEIAKGITTATGDPANGDVWDNAVTVTGGFVAAGLPSRGSLMGRAAAQGAAAASNVAGITAEQASTLRSLLMKIPGVKDVRVFGSRTTGASTALSDLDVLLIGEVDQTSSAAIQAMKAARSYAKKIGIGPGKTGNHLDPQAFPSIKEARDSFARHPLPKGRKSIPDLKTLE